MCWLKIVYSGLITNDWIIKCSFCIQLFECLCSVSISCCQSTCIVQLTPILTDVSQQTRFVSLSSTNTCFIQGSSLLRVINTVKPNSRIHRISLASMAYLSINSLLTLFLYLIPSLEYFFYLTNPVIS